jgi:hypothetical protein
MTLPEVDPALIQLSPEVDTARRVAWVIGRAEHDLAIPKNDLPLDARLQTILEAAMHEPHKVSEETFTVCYHLTSEAVRKSAHSCEGRSL